jgi:peroxidase
MQMITYNEFLPIVIGKKAMEFYKLNVLDSGFTKYDPSVNPSILSEFSSAAYRFGHSIINGKFTLISSSSKTSSYNLRDNFFSPFRLHNGQMDSILRGLLGRSAQRFDPFCHEDLRNHLYERKGSNSGSDLPAMNIQRGRDHGVPGYTKYLKFCFNDVTLHSIDNYIIYLKFFKSQI